MNKILGLALTSLGVAAFVLRRSKPQKTFFVHNDDGTKFRITHTAWFGHTLIWKAAKPVQEFCVEFDDKTYAVNRSRNENGIFHGTASSPAECIVVSKVKADFRYVIKTCSKSGEPLVHGTEKFVKNCGNC